MEPLSPHPYTAILARLLPAEGTTALELSLAEQYAICLTGADYCRQQAEGCVNDPVLFRKLLATAGRMMRLAHTTHKDLLRSQAERLKCEAEDPSWIAAQPTVDWTRAETWRFLPAQHTAPAPRAAAVTPSAAPTVAAPNPHPLLTVVEGGMAAHVCDRTGEHRAVALRLVEADAD